MICSTSSSGTSFTGLHETLGPHPQLRTLADRLAQHIAGGNVRDAEQFDQLLSLCTFSGIREDR